MYQYAQKFSPLNYCANGASVENFGSYGVISLALTWKVCVQSIKLKETRVLITFVYAKCSYQDRNGLWSDLETMPSQSYPWIIVGDFNLIGEDGEQIGGQPKALAAMEDFNDCINNCRVMDLKHVGGSMSWFNGHAGNSRKWTRLDHALVNLPFLQLFQFASLKYMERTTSNHKPMMVILEEQAIGYGPTPLRFQNMWITHTNFIPFMRQVQM